MKDSNINVIPRDKFLQRYDLVRWYFKHCRLFNAKSIFIHYLHCPGLWVPCGMLRPPASITKTIQVRRTRHAGHCWRSKDELISYVLLWTHTYGRAKAGWPARTYIQQLYEDTRCSPEELSEAMNEWEKWQGRVRDIRASGTTWWWWWWNCPHRCRLIYHNVSAVVRSGLLQVIELNTLFRLLG